jgi:hypothetical protein
MLTVTKRHQSAAVEKLDLFLPREAMRKKKSDENPQDR